MPESKLANFENISITFSATELSLIWQGVKLLIERQKANIKESQPPFTQTLNEHLVRLEALEEKLKKINIDIEKQVIKSIKPQ